MAGSAGGSPANVTERRQPLKRKRETPASCVSSKAIRSSTPNAYARRSPPRERDPSPIRDEADERERSPLRRQKRPGAGARITASNREAAEAARRRREEEDKRAVNERQTTATELVAEHYNAVPERGRDWRRVDSKIRGLRSLNNWIKSTLIQKFSRSDTTTDRLCVLDLACGKGGDLGKWENAPQIPALYVGCDIAAVSIDQARQRWSETLKKNAGRRGRGIQMNAEFYVQDAFGQPVGNIPLVRQVGFNPNAGPGTGVIQGGMATGGFDIVSMMFALHYSFESEHLARGMLKNVSGALKKGGRFIGVMPNSDVISATMSRLLTQERAARAPNGGSTSPKDDESEKEEGEASEEEDWDPEKPSEPAPITADADDWDPEKPSEPPALGTEGANTGADDADEDDWDPEKPSEAPQVTNTANVANGDADAQTNGTAHADLTPSAVTNTEIDKPPIEWGNRIYTVRFPRNQPLVNRPLPANGIFRPPYGWRYHYQLEEAVDVPEYVVPWEGFRALAEDYGLELLYRKNFGEVLHDERGDPELGNLAERMGVMSRNRPDQPGRLLVTDDEMEAANFYHAFCFYKT